MKLRFFGRLRDSIADQLELELPDGIGDSEQLRLWLGARHPALLGPGVRIAADDRMLVGSAPLAGLREIAFLPPVSGG